MSAAFLIIDMQNDFVLPDSPFRVAGAWASVPRIREALDAARAAEMPVFHLVREYRADGSDVELFRLGGFQAGKPFAVPGTAGCMIVEPLTPLPGEYRVVKNRFSGFMLTELDLMLRRFGVAELVICGTQYPNCIRATVFDGVSHGYPVTVLTDATSAATDEIAAANILDMRNIGVNCLTVAEWTARLT